MKKWALLAAIYIAIAGALAVPGPRALQYVREIAPRSWTAQYPSKRAMPLDAIGVSGLIRQTLFESPSRRVLILALLGASALATGIILRDILKASRLTASPPWGWTDLVIVFGGAAIFWEIHPAQDPVRSGMLLLKDAASCAWVIAVAGARGIPIGSLGLSPRGIARDGGLGIAAAFLMGPALALIVTAGIIAAGPGSIPSELVVAAPASIAAGVLMIAVLPFFEEIMFRGFFYRLLRGKFGRLLSNLACSALFAGLHGDPGTIMAARFLGSVLMCALYERTGSVWSSAGAHATFNAVILCAPPAVIQAVMG